MSFQLITCLKLLLLVNGTRNRVSCIVPEVDSGSSIALLVMGVIYAGGFLVAAWWFVRRLSRKERPFQANDQSDGNNETPESEGEETNTE